jgi:hypothetical protein
MPARKAASCRERLIRLMNVENSPDMQYPGVPASAGGVPASAAAYCREHLIRLMNVEK